MTDIAKKLQTTLLPILGAGAVGVCPLCWLGSASLLTYLGLGTLIPIWRELAFGLLFIAGIGFLLDFRSHRNIIPLTLLILGGVFLYVGRYVFLSTWGAWPIWGTGALMIIVAVVYNKTLFKKPKTSQHE
ncbi:MAG: hypothetical protein HYT09_03245 [Candidatus Levybacteria bacterium]|nr:hypothetical protein [Candidatus Levybacteria bacterium]MBI4097794.1 hypothetical protein [Candidatus Levybacteria bacterium]